MTTQEHQACLSYAIVVAILFFIQAVVVLVEFYLQIINVNRRVKSTSFKYGRMLKVASYISMGIACTLRVVRYVLLTTKYTNQLALKILFFFPLLLAFTAYTCLISTWGHTLLLATRKPESWIWALKIVILTLNILLYAAMIVGLILEPDFLAYKASLIVGVYIIVVSIGYLVMARIIVRLVMAGEAMTGKTQGRKIIKKLKKRAFWISILATGGSVIFGVLVGVSFVQESTVFILVRHYIYNFMELIILAVMIFVLHKKTTTRADSTASVRLRKRSSGTPTEVVE